MDNSVIIKGTKSGIIVVLNAVITFEELKEAFIKKFEEASDFLGSTQVAVSFEGRALSLDEEKELLSLISKHSKLRVVCLVETDPLKEQKMEKALGEKLLEIEKNTGQFYKGNLRSGQVVEAEHSIIVLGDVKAGAKIISTGNIIVLGTLSGTAFAGSKGNTNAFVLALDMRPTQIRIASLIARSPDNPVKEKEKKTKIVYVEDGNIYMEEFNKNVLDDIRLN
ncbi:MAG: septum site-determining protein MinC [Lachnospiraceae bacterium]|nr:septum site-determining protein MinC [Lachnospiraceae bacterium]